MATITYEATARDGSKVTFELLDDGRVKMTTGKIGAQVHTNAEGMLKMFNGLVGGEAKREARGDHGHVHGEHTHVHEHTQEA